MRGGECTCRDHAQSKEIIEAAAAERDTAKRELQQAKKAHQTDKEAFGRERRDLQSRAAAAEAEAARLDLELAAELQKTERAQQVRAPFEPYHF